MLSSSSFFLSFKLHYFTFLFYVWYPAIKLVSILCLYIHSKHHCYVCYCAVDTLLNQQLFCSMNSFSYFELAWRSRSLKYLNLVPAYFWPLTHMQLKSHSIMLYLVYLHLFFCQIYALFFFLPGHHCLYHFLLSFYYWTEFEMEQDTTALFF